MIILLLIASTLALLVVCFQQNRQLRVLSKKNVLEKPEIKANTANTMPSVDNATSQTAEQGESTAANERRQKDETIHQLESQLEAVRTSQQTSGSPAKSADQPLITGITKMLKDPAMKAMMRTSQKAAMETSYSSLVRYLQLSPEEAEQFKELLNEKQTALMDIGLDGISGSIPADEMKEKTKHITDLTKEFDEKIRTFLGDENYEVYKQYEEFRPEMREVDRFKQSLVTADQLNEEQENNLVVAMHEERKNFSFSANLNQQKTFDPSNFNEDQANQIMNDLARQDERYIARARDILSESQLKQFENNLNQQRVMREMGMKMAVKLLSKPGKSDNTK